MTSHQIPYLLTGLTLAAYWARVLKMAAKTRRQTGNAANLFPAEPLGRALRIIWFPAVGLWIAAPFLALFRHPGAGAIARPVEIPLLISWVAAVGVVICLAVSWFCWKRMGKAWRMGINPDEKTHLVVTGAYAYVRHPIYAISTAMALLSAVAVPSAAMLGAILIHVLLLQWESRREEQYLLQVHGEVYRVYCQTVGRFLPRLRKNAS